MRESAGALLNCKPPINAPTLFIEELNSCSTSGRSPGLVSRRLLRLRLISVRPSRSDHAVGIKKTEIFENITVAGPHGIHTRFPILPLPQKQWAPEVRLKEPIKALEIYQAAEMLSIKTPDSVFYPTVIKDTSTC